MAWKPKEKELTIEEAIESARDTEQKYWFGSLPLMAGVTHNKIFSVHALDSDFKKSKAFLIFINPCQFGGEAAITLAKELIKRYQTLGIQPVFILQPEFHFYFQQRYIESFQKRHQLYFPIVVDNDNIIAKAFSVTSYPEAVLVSNSKIVFKIARNQIINELEGKMIEFLRQHDPGLPTLLPFVSKLPWYYEYFEISIPWRHPVRTEKTVVHAKSVELPNPHKIHPKLEIKGHWIYEEDRLFTKDPSAELILSDVHGQIGMVAQSVTESGESSRLSLEWNDLPLEKERSMEDIFHDDEGNSFSKAANIPKLHKIAQFAGSGKLKLKFNQAGRIPVAFYSFRVAQEVPCTLPTLP